MAEAPAFLLVDHYTTRRQRQHFVCDAWGEYLYASAKLAECLNWLQDNGTLEIELRAGKTRFSLKFERVSF